MPLPTPLITTSPQRLSGAPVFAGTRAPVKALFDYLGAGDPLDAFLAPFPDVPREHAVTVIALAGVSIAPRLPPPTFLLNSAYDKAAHDQG